MIVQKSQPLISPLTPGEKGVYIMALLMTWSAAEQECRNTRFVGGMLDPHASKTGNFSMLVGKVVRKKFATRLKVTSE